MLSLIRSALLLTAVPLLASTVVAQSTLTWTGSVSGDWAEPLNWSGGSFPGPSDTAIVPAGTPNNASPAFADAACANLVVNAGAVVGIPDGRTLTVTNDLTINGRIDALPGSGLRVENDVFIGAGAQFLGLNGAPDGLASIELYGEGVVSGSLTPVLPQLDVVGGLRTLTSGRAAGLFVARDQAEPPVELRVPDAANFVVEGDAFLSEILTSQASGGSTRRLTVNGTTTWDVPDYPAGTQSHPLFVLRCNGTYEANTITTIEDGWIELGGAGTNVVRPFFGSTFPAFFRNLRISEGTRVLENKNVVVLGELEVRANTTFDLDYPETLEVRGTLDTNYANAAIVNEFATFGDTPLIVLSGTGDLRGGSVPIPPLRIIGGVRSVVSASTAQSILMDGNTPELQIRDAITLRVLDEYRQDLGLLSFQASGGSQRILRVDGSFRQNGGTVSSPTGVDNIDVYGDWHSNAGFVMAQGLVRFRASGQLTGNQPRIRRMLLDAGIRTIQDDVEVTAELRSTGGSTDGSGFVEVLSTTIPVNTSTNEIGKLRVRDGLVEFTTSRVGDLELTSGTLRIRDAVTLTVTGDATLTGGALASQASGGSTRGLDIAGNCTILGAVAAAEQNATTLHRVAGDWVSDDGFSMPVGWFQLDGAGPTTIGGPSPTFGNLRTTNSTRTLVATTVVEGELELRSVLELGGQDLEVVGTLDSNHSGGDMNGVGPVRLTGDGELRTNGNSLSPVRLESGVRQVFPTRADAVEIVGGTWRIRDASTAIVSGDVVVSGGRIEDDAGGGSLRGFDVEGSWTQTAGELATTNGTTRLTVAGDWTSESAFVMDAGWVYLDGGAATIDGETPTFRRLRLQSGVKTLLVDAVVTGELFASTGSTDGDGWLEVTGSLSPISTGTNEIGKLRVRDGLVEFTTSRVGDLELTSGTLRIRDAVTLTVTGDATFTGGELASQASGGSTRGLDIAGNCTILGAVAAAEQNATTLHRVAGDWVSDDGFSMPVGWFQLDGAGPTTIGGPSPTFGNLRTTNSTRTLAASTRVEGELELRSVLELGGQDLEVVGTLDSNHSGGDMNGVGPVRLTGDGELRTNGNSLSPVRLESGVRQVFPTRADAVEIVGGTWRIRDASTAIVSGDVVVSGGRIEDDAGGGSLRGFDVEGAWTQTAGELATTNGTTRLTVAGDWTSESAFVMDAGWVYLDGAAATIGGVDPTFRRLRLQSGVKTLLVDTTVTGELFASTGSTAGEPWLEVTGSLTPVSTGSNQIARLRVAEGQVRFSGSRVGDLTLASGELVVLDAVTLRVDGDVALVDGVYSTQVSGGSARGLDVAGNLVQSATTVGTENGTQFLRVAGNWSSNSLFAPTLGTVELDGLADSLLSGSVPGNDPVFPTLRTRNGVREVAATVELTAGLVDVDSGSRLRVMGGGSLDLDAPSVVVDGTLDVESGGRLALTGQTAMTVNGGGRLELIGEAGAPAVLEGTDGGGYSATVNGRIAARDFVVADPGPNGLVINGTYDPVPNDLRGGTFTRPSAAAGSTLLTLGHSPAKTLFFLRFEDPLAVGTFNVRRTSGSTVGLQNFVGLFGGETFEDDLGDRIEWLPPLATEVVFFDARNGAEQVELSFETSVEADVVRFLVEAGPTPTGPFATVLDLAPQGPSVYGGVQMGLAPDVPVFYRLLEEQTGGFLRLLGEDSATPYSSALPANIATVGASGTFATIQAAIDAATAPFSVLRIEPGTYSSFVIDNPSVVSLTLLADGPGVTIDASASPVTIQNLPFGRDVILSGFAIDSGTGGTAVQVIATQGAVVLDDIVIDSGGADPGIDVFAAGAVSVQDCDVTGAPGLRAALAVVAVGGGSLDELDVSTTTQAQTAGVALGSQSSSGGATITNHPGGYPRVDVPGFQALGEPFQAQIDVAPGQFCQLAASATTLPISQDPSNFWQMLLIADATNFVPLGDFTADGFGSASATLELPPVGNLLGLRLVFQTWTIDVVPAPVVRFGGAAPLIAVP